jgi:hypothetical protein
MLRSVGNRPALNLYVKPPSRWKKASRHGVPQAHDLDVPEESIRVVAVPAFQVLSSSRRQRFGVDRSVEPFDGIEVIDVVEVAATARPHAAVSQAVLRRCRPATAVLAHGKIV